MADMSPQPSVFDRLLRDRIIWLGSEVRDENANEIAAKLLLLSAEDSERDIYLYINSPAARSLPAWRSTTPCSSSPTTS
jgi:ATP-dependent Clp protease protease subunit